MESTLAKEIEDILTPVMGRFIARTTVKVQCEKMGVSPEQLRPCHMDELASRIEKIINVYGVGAEVGDRIRALKEEGVGDD